jgi:hypothetical protein
MAPEPDYVNGSYRVAEDLPGAERQLRSARCPSSFTKGSRSTVARECRVIRHPSRLNLAGHSGKRIPVRIFASAKLP